MYLLLGRKRITNAKKKTIPKNSLFYIISHCRGSVTLYATVVAGVLHGSTAPLTLDPYVFCLCRKVSKRAQLRAPTVLLVITPYADAYRYCFTLKIIISLTYILTEIGAQIAYGNISNVVLSFVILHVCFCGFVCTARSQTKFS